MSLEFAASNYRFLKDRLLSAMPDLAEDEQVLLDTLEGESDLPDMLARVLRTAKRIEAERAGLAILINDYLARDIEMRDRAERMRGIVLSIMSDLDIPRLTPPDFTASRSKVGPKVLITNENLIPSFLNRITKTPNKTAIKNALVNGDDVPGAELSNGGETLTIRIISRRNHD